MALWLALAALCGAEVRLVVARFGLLLVMGGRRAVGWRTAGAGLAWFLVATYLLAPLHAGRATRLFETDYGIAGNGPRALLAALPTMAGHAHSRPAWPTTACSTCCWCSCHCSACPCWPPGGCSRWPCRCCSTWPRCSRLHQLRFLPGDGRALLAAGAVAGLAVVRSARRPLLAPCWCCWWWWPASWRYGPAPWARDPSDRGRRTGRPGPARRAGPGGPGRARLGPVQPGPHLGHRAEVREFPNPFRAVNWGVAGDEHPPAALERLQFVVVQRELLGEPDRELLDRLQADPAWRPSSTARAWSCCNAGRPSGDRPGAGRVKPLDRAALPGRGRAAARHPGACTAHFHAHPGRGRAAGGRRRLDRRDHGHRRPDRGRRPAGPGGGPPATTAKATRSGPASRPPLASWWCSPTPTAPTGPTSSSGWWPPWSGRWPSRPASAARPGPARRYAGWPAGSSTGSCGCCSGCPSTTPSAGSRASAGTRPRRVRPRLVDGFAFDAEALLVARRLGLEVVEVPVTAEERQGSKVHLGGDALRMLADVWKVRRAAAGAYDGTRVRDVAG